MTAMLLVLGLEAVLAIAVAVFILHEKAREQEADVTALLDAEWDDWAAAMRSDTPVFDRLAAETFRRQLGDESGWPL